MALLSYDNSWLDVTSIVLLLALEVYHLRKNLFSPIMVLPTFGEESLIVASSTNVVRIDSVVLCSLL